MLNRVISPNNCTTTAITYINCCSAFLAMGEYANLHASETYNQQLEHNLALDDYYNNQIPKDAVSLHYIDYIDIKRKTSKAVLIKLNIQVAPFITKHFETNYMWLPIKHIRLNEEHKKVAIVQWLFERKIDEQCSIIAEREYGG